MIDKISILNLWNERNYRIELVDESLIIVGENGSGKTTVLRIIYNVLSRNWLQLFEEDFERIELSAGDESISINSDDAQGLEDCFVNIHQDFQDSKQFNVITDLLRYCGELTTPERVLEACQVYHFPEAYVSYINRIVDSKLKKVPDKIQKVSEWIKNHNVYPIIYLPTYRRSERYQQERDYLDSRIRRHRGYDTLISDIEVAKEGMKDVDETIKAKIAEIRNEYARSSSELNAKCFKGILTREYGSVKTPEEIINSEQMQKEYYENLDSVSTIFSSISGTEFYIENTKQIEEQLLQLLAKGGPYDDYDRIVVYFYQMLIERYEHMKVIEEPLEAFFYACNKYLTNKKIQYSPNDFRYEIVLEQGDKKEKRTIDLNHLSSGEKQLVSLFCYIYLSNPDKCMVIIDEPELSLSVEWQQSILEDIRKSGKCGSLIAATQSPFVYNNSLRPIAKSLDSFLTVV